MCQRRKGLGAAVSQGFLQSNPQVDCGSGEHRALMGVSVVALVVYTLGIPVFFTCLLWRARNRNSLVDPDTRSRVGWMFENYHLRAFWFDLVLQVEKIFVIALFIPMLHPVLTVLLQTVRVMPCVPARGRARWT